MIYEERIDNFILGKMSNKEEKEFLSECKTNSTLRKEAITIAYLVKGLKKLHNKGQLF